MSFEQVIDPEQLLQLNSFGTGSDNSENTKNMSLITDEAALEQLNKGFRPELEAVRARQLADVAEPQPEDPETWADYISPLLEIGSALAVVGPATFQGMGYGYAFGGPPGAAVGGLAAGVTATTAAVYGSRFAGEGVEALIEGREFNPDKAVQEAMDAAQTEALFSSAFGVAFPVAGAIGTGGKTLLKNKSLLSESQKETIVRLQEKLKTYNASLLPSMVDSGKKAEILTNIAKVSQVTKTTVNNYLNSYGKYMGNQAEELLLRFKSAGPTSQGEVLQALITQTDQALREIVDPLYKNIDALGKKVRVSSSEDAMEVANGFKADFRARPKYNKKEKLIESSLVAYPTSQTKTAVEYLETIPNDLNFYEAHKRLSQVKARLNKAIRSNDGDTDRINVLAATADTLKNAMDEAAEKLSPALKKQYEEVTEMYNKGRKVVTSTYLKKALEVNDPVQIGAMLTSDGLTYGIQEVKELKKLAAEYKTKLPKDSKVKGLDADPVEGIRKGFLAEILKTGEGSIQSFQQLQKKLQEPKFKETFDELFKGTATEKKIGELFDELAILERVQSGGSGFQLAVSSSELGAVRNPKVFILLRSFIPAFLANRAIAPKNIDKVINMIKTAKVTTNKDLPLPKGYEAKLQQLLTGQRVGLGLGALANQVPE